MDRPDVTVVVPARGAGQPIGRCVTSLARQTLSPDRYEVVVVRSGAADGTSAVLDAIGAAHPDLALRAITLEHLAGGRARNVGVAAARGRYVTFVDAEDAVSPTYLAALLARSGPGVVALSLLADKRDPGSAPRFDGVPSQRVLARAGGRVPAESLLPALSFGGGKMLPTALARSFPFESDLDSGEDVVLWASMSADLPLVFAVCDVEEHAVYYRTLRPASASRRAPSYHLDVSQRLDVIEWVRAAANRRPELEPLARDVTTSQCRLVNTFIRTHPDEHRALIDEIVRRELTDIPYATINAGLARELAVLYVAPPYSDTSGTVAARRVAAWGSVVDVVSCRFAGKKPVDPTTGEVWAPYLDQQFETPAAPVSAWWPGMVAYCRAGMSAIERWIEEKGPYRRLYSRTMWPSAHLLAAWYKIRHPEVEWVAEFSDPLLFDMDGHQREGGGRTDPELLAELTAGLGASGAPIPDTDNPYVWLEWLVFALADTVLFTNEHQRRFMLDRFPQRELAARGDRVGVVAAHPVPAPHLYRARTATLSLPAGRLNVGYFGAFYARRGLAEVVAALQELRGSERQRLRLHVFTVDPDALAEQLAAAHLEDVVVPHPFVGYLEYLNLLTRFDVLLVNDARTADTHDVNPYLPSKWSEYSGSGRPVWGIVEPGSILSRQPLAYRSELGDAAGALTVLREMISRADAAA